MMLAAVFVVGGGIAIFGVILGARWWDAQAWRRSLVAYKLSLPHGLTIEQVADWLALVNAATHAHQLALLPAPPVALELVALNNGITHYVLVPGSMRGVLLAHLRAALPGVRLEEAPEYLAARPRFRLAAEAAVTTPRRPLRADLAQTASTALLASLQPLHPGERIHVQWLITGGGIPRVVSSVSAAQRPGAASWWLDGGVSVDSEAVRAERAKQQAPLLRAVVRVGVSGVNRPHSAALFGRVWGTLRIMNAAGAGVVRRWSLPSGLVAGRMQRLALPITAWPLTLNTTELAGLLGLATGDARLPGLRLGSSRQLPPAPDMPTRGTLLGRSNYPGLTQRPLALLTADRLRHMWVAGPTGAGKSTLLANCILQDIQAGAGMVVVDARGDLVPDILSRIPEERRGDVIVVDPSATTRPVGFNILRIGTTDEAGRERAVDHVLHIFHDLYRSSWGPRTADVLRAGLLTLVNTRAQDGSAFTLCELPELLSNRRLRGFVVGQLDASSPLHSFWQWYEGLSEPARAEVIGPVLNKLRTFVLKTSLRLLLGQSDGLDLADVFRKRRIVLVPLSKGTLGAETAQLVGSLLVASVWQVTLDRVRVPATQRRPAWLYADEFQETVRLPIDLADMLAQARGLGLGLVLAHQHLGQLPEAVKTAVLGTARTQVLFQLDYDDARAMERRFAPLGTADLMGLGQYEVAIRPSVSGRTLAVVTGRTLPLPEPITDGTALASVSREHYGVPRRDVEAALLARVGSHEPTSGYGRTPRGRSS